MHAYIGIRKLKKFEGEIKFLTVYNAAALCDIYADGAAVLCAQERRERACFKVSTVIARN